MRKVEQGQVFEAVRDWDNTGDNYWAGEFARNIASLPEKFLENPRDLTLAYCVLRGDVLYMHPDPTLVERKIEQLPLQVVDRRPNGDEYTKKLLSKLVLNQTLGNPAPSVEQVTLPNKNKPTSARELEHAIEGSPIGRNGLVYVRGGKVHVSQVSFDKYWTRPQLENASHELYRQGLDELLQRLNLQVVLAQFS